MRALTMCLVFAVASAGLFGSRAHAGLDTTPMNSFTYGGIGSTVGDVNGDGYGDVAIADPYSDDAGADRGRVSIFLGSSNGLASTPWWTTHGYGGGTPGEYWYFGYPTFGGDFNGDGYGDVCCGAGLLANGMDWFEVYFGGPGGMSGPWTGLPPDDPSDPLPPEERQFSRIANAGDLDGDGSDEVVASNHGRDEVYLYWNGDFDPSATLNEGGSFGTSVASAGDVNADGNNDLLVTGGGGAYLFAGDGSGFVGLAWHIDGNFTGALAGDVNGDGYSDIMLGHGAGTFIYVGWADLGTMPTTPAWTLNAGYASLHAQPYLATAGDIDGNGCADLIIGNGPNDSYGTNAGIAWVYHGSRESGPQLAATLHGSTGQYFGMHVGTAGDVNGDGLSEVLVSNAGGGIRVWIHRGRATPPSMNGQPHWSRRSNQQERFGHCAANAGDVNGDGFSDLIISSPADIYGWIGGWAMIHLGTPSGPTTVEYNFYSGSTGDMFGHSAASAGDVNGDGYSDVIIGSPGYTNGQSSEGRAYLYYGNSSGLSDDPVWTYEPNVEDSELGWSVASAGDVNGDGYADVVIGEPGRPAGPTAPDAGRVNVFFGSATGLPSSPSWVNDAVYDNSRVGASVASAGDVNGDGYSDVMVGQPTDWIVTPWAGRAYVYFGSPDGLPPSSSWCTEGEQEWEYHGASVASAGDVNADGYSDVLVGAPGHDTGSTDAGVVRLYLGHSWGLSPGADRNYTGLSTNEGFGTCVASAGDVDGDGASDYLCSAPYYEGGAGWEAGLVRLYLGVPGGSPGQTYSYGTGKTAYAGFGFSVASAGDCNGDGFADVVIGSPFAYSEGGLVETFFGNYAFVGLEEGRPVTVRQQRVTGAPLDHLGTSDASDGFQLAALARSPLGRTKVRLEWNAAPLGVALDDSNREQGNWQDSGTVDSEGSVLPWSQTVTGLSGAVPIHWRCRVASRSVYFPQGPWFTFPAQTPSLATLRLESPSGVDDEIVLLANDIGPLVAQPNPFRTSIRLTLNSSRKQLVDLSVYDVAGRTVRELWRGPIEAGRQAFTWDGQTSRGEAAPSGIYYARLIAGDHSSALKLTLAR